MTRPYQGISRRDRAIDAAAMAERAKMLGPLLDAADDTWPPGTWVTSDTGFTRVGPDGKSDAHVVRIDYRTWGIGTHWAPCVVWVRCADFSDFAFADEVLAGASADEHDDSDSPWTEDSGPGEFDPINPY